MKKENKIEKNKNIILIVLMVLIFFLCLALIASYTFINSFNDSCEIEIEGKAIADLNTIEQAVAGSSSRTGLPVEYLEINKVKAKVPCGIIDVLSFITGVQHYG